MYEHIEIDELFENYNESGSRGSFKIMIESCLNETHDASMKW